MPLYTYSEFTPKAVQPVECIKAGWDLIKDQYWLFVGLTLVAVLIGQLAPMGILMAPMMCGVYMAIFERMRGQTIEFNVLFKGFDYFGQAVIALLLHLIPVFLVMLPFGVIFASAGILMVLNQSGGEAATCVFVAFVLICAFFLILLLIGVSILFTFAYPLIVDRQMAGVDAVKLSMKAARANFWGLLGLSLLNALMGLLGVLCCYVGAVLVLPVGFAASAWAYRQVFGMTGTKSQYPPPPPTSFRESST